jgi:N-acetyl-anhydromuramyl-L-alanine amidase AmpD
MNLSKINFEGYYIKKPRNKMQIVLHHTVSGGTAADVVNYWKSQHKKNGLYIGTHFIIERNGNIFQLFDLDYWAGHIGNCKNSASKFGYSGMEYSPYSVGIELINWGGLKVINGMMHNAYNKPHSGNSINVNYRGYEYFEPYTDEQIKSLEYLLPYLCNELKIDYRYNPAIWDILPDSFGLKPGIYSHTSFRFDKSDIYPDERIIKLLKSI